MPVGGGPAAAPSGADRAQAFRGSPLSLRGVCLRGRSGLRARDPLSKVVQLRFKVPGNGTADEIRVIEVEIADLTIGIRAIRIEITVLG